MKRLFFAFQLLTLWEAEHINSYKLTLHKKLRNQNGELQNRNQK